MTTSRKKKPAKKTPRKTLRVQFATYAQDGCDGSVAVRFYADEETAEQAAEKDDQRYGEDIRSHELEIDAETGEILSGLTEPNQDDDLDDDDDDDEDDED